MLGFDSVRHLSLTTAQPSRDRSLNKAEWNIPRTSNLLDFSKISNLKACDNDYRFHYHIDKNVSTN